MSSSALEEARQALVRVSVGDRDGPPPQELDFLIHEFQIPRLDSSIARFVGYLYQYLPYIKNEHNLQVVFRAFLHNKVCFGNGMATSEELYPIIEAFKALTEVKLKVSQPLLPVKQWYSIILLELEQFVAVNRAANSWKVLPILTGLSLANDLRFQIHSRGGGAMFPMVDLYFKKWDHRVYELFKQGLGHSIGPSWSNGVVETSLLSLALYYDASHRILPLTCHISRGFAVGKLVDMIATAPSSAGVAIIHQLQVPQGESLSSQQRQQRPTSPFLLHFNKISVLLGNLLSEIPIASRNSMSMSVTPVSVGILSQFLDLNREINSLVARSSFNVDPVGLEPQDPIWDSLKRLLFGQVIIFQEILTACMHDNQSNTLLYLDISLLLLHNLYYLHFVLLSIGSGGFEGYNFVYYFALDVAMDTKERFQLLTERLMFDYQEFNFLLLDSNYVMQSKAIFVLGLWENYVKHGSPEFTEKMARISFDIALQGASTSLVEAAHLVLLAIFGQIHTDISEITGYMSLLFRQFPTVLSSTQLSIAMETLGKSVMNPHDRDVDEEAVSKFLHLLFERCRHEVSGRSISSAVSHESSSSSMLLSAQPVAEVEANSTLSHLGTKGESGLKDIVDANEHKDTPKNSIPKALAKQFGPKSSKHGPEYRFENRLTPETTRESYIYSLINVVPYTPLGIFQSVLGQILGLINESNPQERQFLMKIFWKVLSENLDLNRAAVAYQWWYESEKLTKL